MLELPRRKFLVRAGLALAAAPFITRVDSLMRLRGVRLLEPNLWRVTAIVPTLPEDGIKEYATLDLRRIAVDNRAAHRAILTVPVSGYQVGDVIAINNAYIDDFAKVPNNVRLHLSRWPS